MAALRNKEEIIIESTHCVIACSNQIDETAERCKLMRKKYNKISENAVMLIRPRHWSEWRSGDAAASLRVFCDVRGSRSFLLFEFYAWISASDSRTKERCKCGAHTTPSHIDTHPLPWSFAIRSVKKNEIRIRSKRAAVQPTETAKCHAADKNSWANARLLAAKERNQVNRWMFCIMLFSYILPTIFLFFSRLIWFSSILILDHCVFSASLLAKYHSNSKSNCFFDTFFIFRPHTVAHFAGISQRSIIADGTAIQSRRCYFVATLLHSQTFDVHPKWRNWIYR